MMISHVWNFSLFGEIGYDTNLITNRNQQIIVKLLTTTGLLFLLQKNAPMNF